MQKHKTSFRVEYHIDIQEENINFNFLEKVKLLEDKKYKKFIY